MKRLIAFAFSLWFASSLSADTLRGVVTAPDGQPLAGVSVAVNELSHVTGGDGRFAFDVPAGTYRLRASRDSFKTQTLDVTTSQDVTITLKPALAENIVVSGIRADVETPVTKTDLTRADIEKNYYGQ